MHQEVALTLPDFPSSLLTPRAPLRFQTDLSLLCHTPCNSSNPGPKITSHPTKPYFYDIGYLKLNPDPKYKSQIS